MSEGAGKPKVKLVLKPKPAAAGAPSAGAGGAAELTPAQKSQQEYTLLTLKEYLSKYGFTEDSEFGGKMLAQAFKFATMTPPETKAVKDKLRGAIQAATAAAIPADSEDYRKLMVAYMTDLPLPEGEADALMAAAPAPKPRVVLKPKAAAAAPVEESAVAGAAAAPKPKVTLKLKPKAPAAAEAEEAPLSIAALAAAPPQPEAAPPKKKTILLRKAPAAPVAKTPEQLAAEAKIAAYQAYNQEQVHDTDPYKMSDAIPPAFITPTRLAFQNFIRTNYQPFAIKEVAKPDLEACAAMGAPGEGAIKRFLYQEFVREYLRQETPYRGLLVYHGLGSGKTCTAIAAAEALYGRSNKKVIVMTPSSLKPNFQGELMSCGFKHFHTNNYWDFIKFEDTPELIKFATTYLKINPDSSYLSSLRNNPDPAKRGLWLPDMTKAATPNYKVPDTGAVEGVRYLEAWETAAVRDQLTAMLQGRITFMSYNSTKDTGTTRLQKIACEDPTFFDDAVIVIDEVHNVTRMMCRKMDKDLDPKKRRNEMKDGPFEPFTPQQWTPALCASPLKYRRAYLLYRLLAGAKNSKIIGLSGTPLINFPEELAVISNVLNGYNHTAEFIVRQATEQQRTQVQQILELHPRVDYISVTPLEADTKVVFSIFPPKYKKIFDAHDEFQGITYDPTDVSLSKTIIDIQQDIQTAIQQAGMTAGTTPTYLSYPLLPPLKDEFYNAFLGGDGSKLTNTTILKRRIQGLISYYRGSKADLMPAIAEDKQITVPFTEYSFSKYFEARKTELEGKESKSMEAELEDLEAGINPAYYRFRSRAACNFTFPPGINRPFPTTKKDVIADTGVVDLSQELVSEAAAEMDVTEEQIAEARADAIQEEEIEGEEGAGAGSQAAASTLARVKTYAELCEAARRQLYDRREEFLVLKEEPNEGLVKFSPKMAAILKQLKELEAKREEEDTAEGVPADEEKYGFWAPSLVYSQFMSMEGLGIFGMVLEANGYVPIELEGVDTDIAFTARTAASFAKGPATKERRFCFFSGAQRQAHRKVLLTLFNGRYENLPPKMKQVLADSGYLAQRKREEKTLPAPARNIRGEVCSLIGITAAGAEGISLKNTRSVHIMEPYWNSVRTDQVKGRAVRICSHMDLPHARRNVYVYTYCAGFDPAIRLDDALRSKDNSLTSDQYIAELAKMKDTVNQGLLNIMKATAVDCNLNILDNLDVRCYNPKALNNRSYAYNPDVNDDLRDPPQEQEDVPQAQAKGTVLPQAQLEDSAAIRALMAQAEQERARIIAEQAAAAEAAGEEAPLVEAPPELPPPPPPPSGAPIQVVPEVEIPPGSGKRYLMIPKKNPKSQELFTLYAREDTGQTKPLGLLLRDAATGDFRVKMTSPTAAK